MKSGVIGSLKFKRLKRLLQLPDYAICGVLESIWGLAVEQAKLGDIGRFSDDEIAAGIEWEGDAAVLLAALVESKWLDRSPLESVRLIIHDWPEHAPQFVTRWIARHLGNPTDLKAAWLAKVGLSASDGYPKLAEPTPVASQTGVDKPPYGREPNQTQPNQTKPKAPQTPQGDCRPLLDGQDDDPGDHPPPDKPESEAAAQAWRELIAVWNATPGVTKCLAGNEARRKSMRVRLGERILLDGKPVPWLQAAVTALQRKFPLKIRDGDPDGWKPDIDWFLRPASVLKLLEGKYDWSKNDGKRSRDSGAGQRFDPATAGGPVEGW